MPTPSNRSTITRSLYILVFASIVLLSILSWWLLSNSFHQYQQARNSAKQFDVFYRILSVSNNLATERAYTHEYILSSAVNRDKARASLEQIRQLTDQNLSLIPTKKLNSPLVVNTSIQLKKARALIDHVPLDERLSVEHALPAISALMKATTYYHQAVYTKTAEFIRIEPSILGPILRAQALGELRDVTGRLGSRFLIPLYLHQPIQERAQTEITRYIERIDMQWWLLSTHDITVDGGTEFYAKLEQAREQYQQGGVSLVQTLLEENKTSQRYSISAEQFAIDYHNSLRLFNDLLHRYVDNLQKKFATDEEQAFLHFIVILVLMAITTILMLSTLIIVRQKLLKPVERLNQMVQDIIRGKQELSALDQNTAEEVKVLLSSLDKLSNQLYEQKALSQKLKQQSHEDPLTGLFNRRAFDGHAMQLMYSSCQTNPVWLTVIDLDRFKRINDTWGHLEGDQVLRTMASILNAQQGENELISRTGGEEFIVMFIESDAIAAKNKLANLKQQIESTPVLTDSGQSISFTASFGVASGYQCSLTALVSQADKYLYQAKRNGRNCIFGHGFSEPTPKCSSDPSIA